MAPRKRRKVTIDLEKGPDGEWRQTNRFEHPPGSFDESAGKYRVLGVHRAGDEPGLLLEPGLGAGRFAKQFARDAGAVILPPPVGGSIGRWRGKGTKRDPYHWVGVSEKLAAYTALGLLGVWGLEVISTDVSNWWQSSALNVSNDLAYFENLGIETLNALGIPYHQNSSGHVDAVAPRTHGTFFTWFFREVMLQGADLEQATSTVNQLSTGFPSGGGLSSLPPSSAPSTGPPAGLCPTGITPAWNGYNWYCPAPPAQPALAPASITGVLTVPPPAPVVNPKSPSVLTYVNGVPTLVGPSGQKVTL